MELKTVSRQPKPYYRKFTKSWYCTIDGNRTLLGKNREDAHQKFHQLMANRTNLVAEVHTVYELTQVYLDWCESNRSSGTYENHKRILKSLIESIGKTMKVARLESHHLTKWIDSLPWKPTSKNDAISVAQRMFNWAIEHGHLRQSPIPKIKKPKRQRREVHYTKKQWDAVREHANGCFTDFLDFLWSTGCRPKEARDLEARHVDLKSGLAMFQSAEAKGEIPRVIFLTPESREILARLIKKRPEGRIFLNSRGLPWTKDSVKCRLTRISKKVGFRVIAYGARHSYCTRALKQGVNATVVASLMGHKDASMISKVYSHLAKDIEFLKVQAKNVS